MAIKSFVRLKSKMYTFITKDIHEFKKEKDINENVVHDEIKYEGYSNVLFKRSYMRHEMKRIRSKDQNIGSYRVNNFFCLFTTIKMYILKDGYSRLTYCHKPIFVNQIKIVSLNIENLF